MSHFLSNRSRIMSGILLVMILVVGLLMLIDIRMGLVLTLVLGLSMLDIIIVQGIHFSGWLWLAWAVLAIYTLPKLRKHLITQPFLAMLRRRLPHFSATERAALDAGTVWWDADLFGGRPDWHKLLSFPRFHLSSEEQEFLSGPVETLC